MEAFACMGDIGKMGYGMISCGPSVDYVHCSFGIVCSVGAVTSNKIGC